LNVCRSQPRSHDSHKTERSGRLQFDRAFTFFQDKKL
jgi:hypothetical protein